jgi:hypothetical protein
MKLRHLKVVGSTLVVAVLGHLLYRRVFCISISGDELGADPCVASAVSLAVVVIGVAAACRSYPSWRSAAVGGVIAGVTAEAYVLCADWMEVGWNGLVGHDMWFGDEAYWVLSGVRIVLYSIALALVAAMSWGIRRTGAPVAG